jgi:putative hydrolase of the HAD superfamily
LIKAILFDLDDTLHDRDASLDIFIQDQYRKHKLNHPTYEIYRQRLKELDEHGYGDRFQVYQTLIDEFALPLSVERMVTDFRSHAWTDARTFPGTVPVLMELRHRGFKLGIVTNGTIVSQRAKLFETGLLAHVDEALISEEEKVAKPDPEIFTRAAEKLGLGVDECAFVGDHPANDIAGAHAAGMRTVWLKKYLPWPPSLALVPDHTIIRIEELLGIEW